MPVYKGNEFIERIYKGNERLRRIYKGNELVYGLYDITYNDRGNLYDPSNDEITEYAWGLQRDIAPANGNTDFDDTFDMYKSHWFGWYDDANYGDKRPQYDEQYIVVPDDKEDLNLYAKWKQKKFSYSITYTETTTSSSSQSNSNSSYDYEDLPADGTRYDELPSHWYSNNGGWYTWPANYPGQCVWGAAGRTAQMRNSYSAGAPNPDSFPDANQWLLPEKHYGNWSSTVDWSKVQVGDCILYGCTRTCQADDNSGTIYVSNNGRGGHVVVVEKVLGDGSFEVSTWNEGDLRFHGVKTENSTPGYFGMYGQTVSGYLINHIDKIITDESTSTTTSTSTSSVTTTVADDCPDQENPYLPDEILNIINADPVVTPVEPEPGLRAELPEVGTHWDELPSSWYGENGGWYWDRVYPGECVWGANGRTGQLRNNAAAAAPYSNAYRGWYNANDWIAYGYGDGHGGNWTSTVDWRKVQVGDCILYGSVRTIEADDGSGTIYTCSGNHVVVVEEVLGDGRFLVSTWNSGGDHNFHGTYVEDSKPGERSSYTGVVSGYLINHIDPVIGASGGSTTTTITVDELDYITSERTFDYNINNWGDWKEVDISPEDWNYIWGEE